MKSVAPVLLITILGFLIDVMKIEFKKRLASRRIVEQLQELGFKWDTHLSKINIFFHGKTTNDPDGNTNGYYLDILLESVRRFVKEQYGYEIVIIPYKRKDSKYYSVEVYDKELEEVVRYSKHSETNQLLNTYEKALESAVSVCLDLEILRNKRISLNEKFM